MANTNNILPGSRVLVNGADLGTVLYVTADGWLCIRLDGEQLTHEWNPVQVAAA